ncbi:Hypothetical predicted protein [Cloeon dipterum]|uniref:Uncharacterized protein n=1 Tax=Cloeon dipterum TaxID=197152 RepID=A0A8S1BXN2_9INSE|nr:Hypothetical predicted protein [Cloeon dipterum]
MVSPTLANEREMRPDQDPDEVSSRNQCCRTVDKPRDPDRTRDLFGLQLEVTSLLLEAERRKLSVLQRELQAALAEGGSIKAKEQQKHELILAISRIQGQHEQLEKEYRQHAIGVLRCSNTRGSGKVSTFDLPQVAPLDNVALSNYVVGWLRKVFHTQLL